MESLSLETIALPDWQLALFMAIMGGGSGFFASPNVNAIMSSVEPHTRGVAALRPSHGARQLSSETI